MKIETLQAQFSAQHSAQQRERVTVQAGRALPQPAQSAPPQAAQPARSESAAVVQLSASALQIQFQAQIQEQAQAAAADVGAAQQAQAADSASDLQSDKRYFLVKALYEQITGLQFDGSRIEFHEGAQQNQGGGAPANAAANAAPPGRSGSGLTIVQNVQRIESEQTSFSAQGSITTADGRQIQFDLQFELQRLQVENYTSVTQISTAPRAKDPLALNFGGQSAALSAVRSAFDVDADGQTENVAFLAQGSFFLALDKNADGKINDGSELFGPANNDGFAELAQYDDDQNRVIDENDAIFSKLLLFNRDANGNDQLLTIAQKDVGAILLDHAETPFTLFDGDKQAAARLRSSGVYLREDGGVGSVQQVDLLV